eukprot:7862649-Pyramimonas_sp.AAC.1
MQFVSEARLQAVHGDNWVSPTVHGDDSPPLRSFSRILFFPLSRMWSSETTSVIFPWLSLLRNGGTSFGRVADGPSGSFNPFTKKNILYVT